jgi:hypothetical protein
MLRNFLISSVLFLSLAACAIQHKQLDDNPAYSSHQYRSADMDISWKSEKTDNILNIIGTLTNVRAESGYDYVELEATIIDNQGKILAKQTINIMPIGTKSQESFKMSIPFESGMQPEKIKFNYRYGIDEDRHSVKFDSKL